jgi:periplasmic protein TonB
MFEESLVTSQASLLPSPRRAWATIVSVAVQCAIVAALAVIPLLHPETLRLHTEAPRVRPTLRRLPPVVVKLEPLSAARTAAVPAPAAALTAAPVLAFAHSNADAVPDAAPIAHFGNGDMGAGPPTALGTGAGSAVRVVPATAAPKTPVRVSAGVSAGLLLQPIRPVYPRIAVLSRTEGTVVVEAIISKSGAIVSAQVLSGPPMLRQAALDAVAGARYAPYKLNGEPTDVETTITINFRLGG